MKRPKGLPDDLPDDYCAKCVYDKAKKRKLPPPDCCPKCGRRISLRTRIVGVEGMGANPGDVYLCPCGTRLGVGRRGETLVLDPILALLLALVLTLAPLLARAEVQPVLKGEPAPLTGLVMDEMTFMRYANTEVALAGCKVEGEAARAQVNALAASSATSAANAPSAPSSGYFWLGAITGAAAAVLVLYGAAQLLKAAPAERAARQGAR